MKKTETGEKLLFCNWHILNHQTADSQHCIAAYLISILNLNSTKTIVVLSLLHSD